MNITNDNGVAFAAAWADAWNRRDIEAVLAHFQEDIAFTSPTALAVMGVPTIYGKESLRAYWKAALALCGSLHFTVNRVLWDPAHTELAIIYISIIDGKTRKVSENLCFNKAGRVVSAEVFHGVPGQP